jgi:hypothetical protein
MRMVFIPGSNNGVFGMGMSRGAMFPMSMGGSLGRPGYPLPNMIQHPTATIDKPYYGNSFGKTVKTIYQLTPGGSTTEESWGFTNKIKSFGRSRKSKRKSRKSKRKSRKSKRKSRKSKRKSRKQRRKSRN